MDILCNISLVSLLFLSHVYKKLVDKKPLPRYLALSPLYLENLAIKELILPRL